MTAAIAQEGRLDNTFGQSGTVIASDYTPERDAKGGCVAVQANGKIIVAGTYYGTTYSGHAILTRYNTNGTIDNSFGVNGTYIAFFYSENINKIFVQPDGKILIVGSDYSSTNDGILFIKRLLPSGSVDNSFGINGVVKRSFAYKSLAIGASFLQNDGSIILAGNTWIPSTGKYGYVALKYTSSGLLDSSFGVNGLFEQNTEKINYTITNMRINTNGKILLSAYVRQGSIDNWSAGIVILLDSNGTLDRYIAFLDNNLRIRFSSIAIQLDNKIILGGYIEDDSNGYKKMLITRYNADGNIDNSFGINGVFDSNISSANSFVTSINLLPNGKILVGGYGYNDNSNSNDFAILRLNSNGRIDNTFGTNGFTMTNFASTNNDQMNDIALQPDGKIITVGTTYSIVNINTYRNIALARYTSNPITATKDVELFSKVKEIYPNPIEDNFSLKFDIEEAHSINIDLYDLSGKLVSTFLKDKYFGIGEHNLNLNLPTHLSSGNFLLIISDKERVSTLKLIKK
jgi:uncharacterized delta-60 repeat protein